MLLNSKKIFWTCYKSSNVHCHNSNALRVTDRGPRKSHPWSQKTKRGAVGIGTNTDWLNNVLRS